MHGLAFGRTADILSLVIAALAVAGGPVSAATLVLKDGSVVHGEIKTLQDSVYTVETDALGTVRVRQQDIRSIDLSDESASGTPLSSSAGKSPAQQPEVQDLQSQMLQIPGLFSMIQALQSDPEVQAVLSDPEITSAVASGDFAKLMSNPKIIALLGNANVREVIDEVQ